MLLLLARICSILLNWSYQASMRLHLMLQIHWGSFTKLSYSHQEALILFLTIYVDHLWHQELNLHHHWPVPTWNVPYAIKLKIEEYVKSLEFGTVKVQKISENLHYFFKTKRRYELVIFKMLVKSLAQIYIIIVLVHLHI